MIAKVHRREVSLANWREHPVSRWSFQNVREIVPTAAIVDAADEIEPSVGPAALDSLALVDPDGTRLTAERHFLRSHADCVVILRHGEVVADWHADHADPRLPHVVFSVSKSITGMLAGIAVGDGALDPDEAIATYVPVEPGSAYADARVRDLLDMTVRLEFEEDYLDLDGAFDRYRRAMLWNPERFPGATETMLNVLGSLPRSQGRHGDRFYYASPNTDMLGLVIEAATATRYATYLADRLWKPLGATGPAYVTVDRVGAARAAGGVCVTVVDLARFGHLVMAGGVDELGHAVIPAAWIADMRSNGNRDAWTSGNFAHVLANGRYRSCWYDVGDGRGSFCAMGIHGQYIWADPTSGVVIAKTSSRPIPSDDAATLLELDMLGQIARSI